MHVMKVRNVEEALFKGLMLLAKKGEMRESRAGKCIVHPGPVTTQTLEPTERVLLWGKRDANPFFHLHEALWMLAGRDDVGSVTEYVRRMREFSDDGSKFNAAYGFRWRGHFGRDQIADAIAQLKANPDDRRVVIGIWDPSHDLGLASKDLPCNTHIYLSLTGRRRGRRALDMTVCCRSNDAIWGAHGANAVHFSVLQEYVAAHLGVPVGTMWQMSNNYHAYESVYGGFFDEQGFADFPEASAYERGEIEPKPLVHDVAQFDRELFLYFQGCDQIRQLNAVDFQERFFYEVAIPMRFSWMLHRKKQPADALAWAQEIKATDWRRACVEWLQRRSS